MNLLHNIFNFTKKRKSIPKAWCGLWADKNGKQVLIEATKHNFYAVTIFNAKGASYEIKLLGNNKKNTIGLIGRLATDIYGNSILQVEAGSDGVGPTYNLYFLVAKSGQKLRLAQDTDDLNNIIARPNVSIGLYDDWEDDMGVPWAFPLEDLKKVSQNTPKP